MPTYFVHVSGKPKRTRQGGRTVSRAAYRPLAVAVSGKAAAERVAAGYRARGAHVVVKRTAKGARNA